MIAPSLTRADVSIRLSAAKAEIARFGVRRLALFGSVQRNAAQPDSDVDVLVEFETGKKTYKNFFELGELLEHLLEHRVELVTLESLSPFLKERILIEASDVIGAA